MLTLQAIPHENSRELYRHMKRDFPSNERMPYFVMRNHMKSGGYKGVYLLDGGAEAAYAVLVTPEGSGFALVLFFAVMPEMREKGIGTRFLQLLRERYSDKTLVLEVEDPSAASSPDERNMRLRRIGFYERAGFRIVPTKSVRIFGVEMLVMVSCGADVGGVREMMHTLYSPVLPKNYLKLIDVRE